MSEVHCRVQIWNACKTDFRISETFPKKRALDFSEILWGKKGKTVFGLSKP
jgi:hypothetical protein